MAVFEQMKSDTEDEAENGGGHINQKRKGTECRGE